MIQGEQTADCFTIRYAPEPINPASAAVLGIVAGGVTLVAVSLMAPPGTFAVLAQILSGGLVLACLVSLASGKAPRPK